jgi:hypothetical protein
MLDRNPSVDYTYVGLDYPSTYPVGLLETVAMTLHESVRLAVNTTDGVADKEWRETTLMIDSGHGRLRLGPAKHIFITTHYHQMHCLRVFQHALLGIRSEVDESHSGAEHVNHCLDYLRQTILCTGNDSLEAGDFMARDWEMERLGGTLLCRDWDKLYKDMGTNFADWNDWARQWN